MTAEALWYPEEKEEDTVCLEVVVAVAGGVVIVEVVNFDDSLISSSMSSFNWFLFVLWADVNISLFFSIILQTTLSKFFDNMWIWI